MLRRDDGRGQRSVWSRNLGRRTMASAAFAGRISSKERDVKVHGVVWVGVRTEAFDATVTFFRDSLGIDLGLLRPDFAFARMPNTSQLEIFGPGDPDHGHFTTGPVPEFLVDDVAAAVGELRAAGVEILGEPHVEGEGAGWAHFRAPDGNVYGVTNGPQYRR